MVVSDSLTSFVANATEEFFVRNAPLYQVCALINDVVLGLYANGD